MGVYEPLGLNLGAILGVGNTADGAILNAQAASRSSANICADVLNGHRNPARCETLNGQTPQQLGIVDIHDSASLARPAIDNEWWGAALNANWLLGDFELTSITSYDQFDHGRVISFDGIPSVQQDIDYKTRIEAWSQELRLAHDNGGAFTWLIGANVAHDEQDEDSVLIAQTGLLPFALGGLTTARQIYKQETDAYSIFGRADWALSDTVTLVGETRYTEEKKAFDGGVLLSQVNVQLTYADDTADYDAVSGKLGLEYRPTDDTLFYGNISRGFKSGGFFGGFATNNAQLAPFDQETITAYEAGFKSEWPDSNLRLNGSAFVYDRQDVQANGLDTSGAVNIARLTNIGDAETKGAELETIWAPTNIFSLQAALAYVTTEIVSSDKVTSALFNSTTTASFEGARLPNQPELSANLTAKLEDNLTADLLGSVAVEFSYRSEQDLSPVLLPQEATLVTEDGYTLVNLRGSIANLNNNWTVSAFVTNLFDEEYRTSASFAGPAGGIEIYGEPKLWGIALEHQF